MLNIILPIPIGLLLGARSIFNWCHCNFQVTCFLQWEQPRCCISPTPAIWVSCSERINRIKISYAQTKPKSH